MKKIFLIIYLIVLLAELTGVWLNNETIQMICKPLLMPVLVTGFVHSTKNSPAGLKAWIISALLFSWVGDVLLLFQSRQPIFFLLGLASFLLAHIFYIIFFYRIRVQENIRSRSWLLMIVVIYYAVLMVVLSPYLAEMKFPVRIYGIVISFMFLLAMHMLYIRNKPSGRWMMTGALLFVISDSILAFDKFYSAFDSAGILIMLTYGLAQLFLVTGAQKYLSNSK